MCWRRIKPTGFSRILGATKEGLPFISVDGGFSLGNNFEGQLPQTGNTFQFADNFSKIMGNHSFKFGGDIRYQKFNQTLYYNVNGSINFGPGGANDTGDDSYANLSLLGLPNSLQPRFRAGRNWCAARPFTCLRRTAGRSRPNLTLNYGLRWEMNTPLTDIGQKVQTFRPGQVSTIYPCNLDPSNPLYDADAAGSADCHVGRRDAGRAGIPGRQGSADGLTNTYFKAFAPRLGFNWSPAAHDGPLEPAHGWSEQDDRSAGAGDCSTIRLSSWCSNNSAQNRRLAEATTSAILCSRRLS